MSTKMFSTTKISFPMLRRKCFLTTVSAKKPDSSDDSRTPQNQPIFPRNFPKKILSQSVIAVLGLGFIDAGYSGDWSRIGVISKESENLLKIAAFVVVPLCFFLILSFSKKDED